MNMEEFYESVEEFNNICGNLQGDMVQLVDNQIGYQFEELTETIDAFEKQDAVELLDGAIDSLYIVVGLLQKLESAGFNVREAMKRVAENNLSKFPDTCGFPYNKDFSVSYNEKYGRWIIKDGSGKVRKPDNFVPVDLSDCVPKDFFNKQE